jgi:hypothetical protein
LKLHGLPFLHDIPDCYRPGRLVCADEIPDKKIPAL